MRLPIARWYHCFSVVSEESRIRNVSSHEGGVCFGACCVSSHADADASPFSGSTRGLPSSGRCLRCRESILDVKFESVQHARNRLQVDPHLLCGSGRGAGGNGAQNLPVGVQSSCGMRIRSGPASKGSSRRPGCRWRAPAVGETPCPGSRESRHHQQAARSRNWRRRPSFACCCPSGQTGVGGCSTCSATGASCTGCTAIRPTPH